MKKILKKKGILIAGGICLLLSFPVILFWDAFYGSNFRSMQDTIWSHQSVNLTGLRNLQASGGTSVRFADLKRRLKEVKGPKIIVDGMAEFHGYVYGIPTTFFGYQRKGSPSFKHLLRRLILTGTTDFRPDLVIPEEVEAQTYGFGYKKVTIGSNFIAAHENIDEIVRFYDSLPENMWVHFHCAHGKGRTSLLLVMFDIMKNAPKVPLNDIVKRQHLLGSEDLFNTEVWKKGTYTKEMLEKRKKFVEEFYDFICQRKAGGTQNWSAWQALKMNTLPRGESE